MKINTKSIIWFIIIDISILIILILEGHYIGSHGVGRLESNNPSSYDEILNNIHIFFIESSAITTFSFWLYFKSNKSKK
jgi:hypothetical protein